MGVLAFSLRCAGVLLVVACESSSPASDAAVPTIHASDFDQSCAESADCVAVEDDTPCCNVCPNAAINAGALSAFDAERAHQATLCTPQERQCASFACNTADHSACSNGTCVFVQCSGSVCPTRTPASMQRWSDRPRGSARPSNRLSPDRERVRVA